MTHCLTLSISLNYFTYTTISAVMWHFTSA